MAIETGLFTVYAKGVATLAGFVGKIPGRGTAAGRTDELSRFWLQRCCGQQELTLRRYRQRLLCLRAVGNQVSEFFLYADQVTS